MDTTVRLSVRKLVEFILRSGDIDSGFAPNDRMAEGARAHRALQKANRERFEDYRSEVTLSSEIPCRDFTFVLEGRADGIISDGGSYTVEEIKTTMLPLEHIREDDNPAYWGQAKCYACLFAEQNELSEIGVQLLYHHLDSGESKCFQKRFTLAALQAFLSDLIEQYYVWAAFSAAWIARRNASAAALPFPYPQYRKGQRELAVAVYRAIDGGRKLFAQAPTGTGKTISALFPAVKAMGEGKLEKIFYLTAKTITRQVAEEAVVSMRRGGLDLKTLTLTAKEKICFCEETVCKPEVCPYAKGHFDRVNGAALDCLEHNDHITRETVEDYAKRYSVCPYELSLDVSNFVDCVICDYNYVFDPRAYLRRFFMDGGGDYVFLIDEAHNLVDRSREMFSSELTKQQFSLLKKKVKGSDRQLDKVLTAINKAFLELRKDCAEKGHSVSASLPEALCGLLQTFTAACERLFKDKPALGEDSAFLETYFEALNFSLIAEGFDERYVTFTEVLGGEVKVKLFCLDPSRLLAEATGRGISAVFFSATLTPLPYFRELLGGEEEDRLLQLDSPFDSGNLCLLSADHISTTFKNREQSARRVAELAGAFVLRRTGNYIIYFPSYKYMHDVYAHFAELHPGIRSFEQENAMDEVAREEFLSRFEENPKETMAAFCVLGGIFSEGIDLKGDRLIGTAIVSVGLPQLSVQQDIIRDYFAKTNGMGFEYAYMYPGMNKVLQAAGRVIRSETDRGAVLLIDERFGRRDYLRLFPKHWQRCVTVRNPAALERVLRDFWADNP